MIIQNVFLLSPNLDSTGYAPPNQQSAATALNSKSEKLLDLLPILSPQEASGISVVPCDQSNEITRAF